MAPAAPESRAAPPPAKSKAARKREARAQQWAPGNGDAGTSGGGILSRLQLPGGGRPAGGGRVVTFNPVVEKASGRKDKKKARTSGGGAPEAPLVRSVVATDEGAKPHQSDAPSGRKPIASRIAWP